MVEAEKTALIGSAIYPDYVWLATGGKSQLSIEKMKVLTGRTVVMFPDVDGYKEWTEKAKQFTFCKVTVSDILEKNATPDDREKKIDIADWFIKSLSKHSKVKKELTEAEKNTLFLTQQNPLLETLIYRFDLVTVNNLKSRTE